MIYINAYGGGKIGIGHIMRSCSLCQRIMDSDYDVLFITNSSHIQLTQSNIPFKVVQNNDEIMTLLNKGDLLIIDRYDINQEFIDSLKQKSTIVGYIDDLGKVDYISDFVINGNVYANKLIYSNAKKYFLGSDYTLINQQFVEAKPIEIKRDVSDILVTFGGSDPSNLTISLIKELSRLTKYQFHIVIGPHFKQQEKFIAYNNIIYYFSPTKMINIMKKCDIAITASGSTMYELASLGIPIINVVVANNQELIADAMSNMSCSINLGYITNTFEIVNNLIELSINYERRLKMSESSYNLINRKSLNKLSKELMALLEDYNE